MKLQTYIPFKKQNAYALDYSSSVLLLGSCFVEHISDKLNYFKFQTFHNPLGILFHPKAVEHLIVRALDKKEFTDKDVFFHNEQWHCFMAHSKLSNTSKTALIEVLNQQLEITCHQLYTASHVVITLGTAWVYKNIVSQLTVANCHKLPQHTFEKELLSIASIKNSLQNILSQIRTVNPDIAVIFTVSPIRHLKDGFVENTRSKAHLIAAIHEVIASDKKANFYFPSYEIMMDELRDYRFYAEDMIHPNPTAINYIWDKFKNVWIIEEAREIMAEVEDIQKAMAHLPFNPTSQAHASFLKQLEIRKLEVQRKVPQIVF